jgi:hypothetical protein
MVMKLGVCVIVTGNYRLAERLLASEERLSSVKLVGTEYFNYCTKLIVALESLLCNETKCSIK